MAQQSIPASPSYRYTHYSDLKGIDLTCDETQTPRNRAADILNMIPDDATGNPRKRKGWRKLCHLANDTTFLGSRHIVDWGLDLIATNNAVYYHSCSDRTWGAGTVKTLITNSAEVDGGVGFVGFDTDRDYRLNVYGKRYIITNDGNGNLTATEITDGYIPITVISRNPDGTDGYAYEAVNAFTPKREIQFLNTDSVANFYFYPEGDRDNHVVVGINKVYQRDADGEWEEIDDFTPIATGESVRAYSKADKSETQLYPTYTGFTLDDPTAPVVVGQDNVAAEIIEFSPDTDEYNNYYGYSNPIVTSILKNNVCARYGRISMDREFYAAQNGRIYYTDANNYDYLPDNNYFEVEVDAPIVGFHRKNSYLVAITQSSAEYTVFMISGQVGAITHSVINDAGVREESTEETTYFIARTALAGTGAVSNRTFATLVDDTLFLSKHGIYGITSNSTYTQTVVANRSELINPRLVTERNLENAVATVWNGMYLLAINSHVYILDSRVTHKNLGVSYGYECYYWDNVPASDFLTYDGNLFFGDKQGNWCRFNSDIENYTAYEDDGTMDEYGNLSGGNAIHAFYKLTLDSDGSPQYFKTLNKRGTVIELMSLPNSELKLSAIKDGLQTIYINTITSAAGRFSWTLVDFENFSFDGGPRTIASYPKKKIKKYKYLQFILESDSVDTDFGVNGLTKTYYFGNFAKG